MKYGGGRGRGRHPDILKEGCNIVLVRKVRKLKHILPCNFKSTSTQQESSTQVFSSPSLQNWRQHQLGHTFESNQHSPRLIQCYRPTPKPGYLDRPLAQTHRIHSSKLQEPRVKSRRLGKPRIPWFQSLPLRGGFSRFRRGERVVLIDCDVEEFWR
jgi:hypothetical protein